jgi:hypothetical protein
VLYSRLPTRCQSTTESSARQDLELMTERDVLEHQITSFTRDPAHTRRAYLTTKSIGPSSPRREVRSSLGSSQTGVGWIIGTAQARTGKMS